MDGLLSFYEQQRLMLKINLNDFMLPGPITYVESNETFLLVNPAMELQCYLYNDLVQFGAAE